MKELLWFAKLQTTLPNAARDVFIAFASSILRPFERDFLVLSDPAKSTSWILF
jgi:hypothetical protein